MQGSKWRFSTRISVWALVNGRGRQRRYCRNTTGQRYPPSRSHIPECIKLEPITWGWLANEVSKKLVGWSAQAVLKRILTQRLERARDVLLEELRQGRAAFELDAPDADEAVAILWRYYRAAEEGAARLNLRLMASVIDGQCTVGALYADEFLRWAELLSDLSREEVIFLATLYRLEQSLKTDTSKTGENSQLEETNTAAKTALVGSVLQTDEEFAITAAALIRTGLILDLSVPLLGGIRSQYKTSSRFSRLVTLMDIEGVIARSSDT